MHLLDPIIIKDLLINECIDGIAISNAFATKLNVMRSLFCLRISCLSAGNFILVILSRFSSWGSLSFIIASCGNVASNYAILFSII